MSFLLRIKMNHLPYFLAGLYAYVITCTVLLGYARVHTFNSVRPLEQIPLWGMAFLFVPLLFITGFVMYVHISDAIKTGYTNTSSSIKKMWASIFWYALFAIGFIVYRTSLFQAPYDNMYIFWYIGTPIMAKVFVPYSLLLTGNYLLEWKKQQKQIKSHAFWIHFLFLVLSPLFLLIPMLVLGLPAFSSFFYIP